MALTRDAMNPFPLKKTMQVKKTPSTMLFSQVLKAITHLHLRLFGAASMAPKFTKDKEDVCAKLGKWRHQHFHLHTVISALQTAPDNASPACLLRSHCSCKACALGLPRGFLSDNCSRHYERNLNELP